MLMIVNNIIKFYQIAEEERETLKILVVLQSKLKLHTSIQLLLTMYCRLFLNAIQ